MLALAVGFEAVFAVTLGFVSCLEVAFIAEVAVAGRVVEVAGLVAVVGLTVRLVAEVLAGFAVAFVVAGRVVVVEVEGLAVGVVGRAWVEGVRLMFC